MNNIDEHLEFKLSEEGNNTIKYLDLFIHRNTNSVYLGIYRKPTHTDVITQFSSNHHLEHKLAAFDFYINSCFQKIKLYNMGGDCIHERV